MSPASAFEIRHKGPLDAATGIFQTRAQSRRPGGEGRDHHHDLEKPGRGWISGTCNWISYHILPHKPDKLPDFYIFLKELEDRKLSQAPLSSGDKMISFLAHFHPQSPNRFQDKPDLRMVRVCTMSVLVGTVYLRQEP